MRLSWLGSEALSWRDLWVIVRQSPRTSAVARSTHPESIDWGLTEHLLASVFDALQAANWQRGGGKGARPKQWPRPGVGPEQHKVGSKAIPMDEMAKRLGWNDDTEAD